MSEKISEAGRGGDLGRWNAGVAAEEFLNGAMHDDGQAFSSIWRYFGYACERQSHCSIKFPNNNLVRHYLISLAVAIETYIGFTKAMVLGSIYVEDEHGAWSLTHGFAILGKLLAIGMSATEHALKVENLLRVAGLAIVLAGLGSNINV